MKPVTPAKPVYKATALHRAIDNKKLTNLHKLLARKEINIDQQSRTGYTALYLAYINGFYMGYDYFFALLEAGADPYVSNKRRNNILHSCISSERLSWVRLLLWYKPEGYADVIGPYGERAYDEIKWWDHRRPELNILKKIEETLLHVQAYRRLTAVAANQLSQTATSTQPDTNYLMAAQAYAEIAVIFSLYIKEAEADAVLQQKWPDEYQATRTHYSAKALQYYQLAIDSAYSKVAAQAMTDKQQTDCLSIYHQVIRWAEVLDKKALAQTYRAKAAEFCSAAAEHNLEKNSDYQQQAAQFYADYYNAVDRAHVSDQAIMTLTKAAQFYTALSSSFYQKQAETEGLKYQQQGRAIYQALGQACHKKHKPEQARLYSELAGINTAAPAKFDLFKSYLKKGFCFGRFHKSDAMEAALLLIEPEQSGLRQPYNRR